MSTLPPRRLSSPQSAAADAFYASIIPIVLELHTQGLSLREIARELDKREIRTRQSSDATTTRFLRWNAPQVRRILQRAGIATPQPSSPSRKPSAPALARPAAAQPASAVAPVSEQQQHGSPVRHPAATRAPRAPVTTAPRSKPAATGAVAVSSAAPADGIFVKLGGLVKGPWQESRVRAMLKAGAVGAGSLGRRDGSGVWIPLGELLA